MFGGKPTKIRKGIRSPKRGKTPCLSEHQKKKRSRSRGRRRDFKKKKKVGGKEEKILAVGKEVKKGKRGAPSWEKKTLPRNGKKPLFLGGQKEETLKAAKKGKNPLDEEKKGT